MHKLLKRISKNKKIKKKKNQNANISIGFASSKLSSASQSKGGIFMIEADLNLN